MLKAGHSRVRGSVAVAVEQADLVGDLLDVDGPVGAAEAFDGSVVAERDEQHLRERRGGQLAVRVDLAAADAAHDALGSEVFHVAGGPVVGRQVGKAIATADHGLSGLVAEQQISDDLRALGTLERIRRTEAGFVAAQDADGGHDVNRFGVVDVIRIRILGRSSVGANRGQTQGHDQRQYQRE